MKTRTLVLPVLALITLLSTACTTMTQQPVSSQPVFLGFQRLDIQRDYLDRYTCTDGKPLMCTCRSRLSTTCDCACHPF